MANKSKVKNKTNLEVNMQILIGHASKSGATEEELKTLTDAMSLIRKYQPVRKKEEHHDA